MTDPIDKPELEQIITVPVVAEELFVEKHRRDTGGVRVTKVIREHEEEVDIPLLREDIDIERVTVGRILEQPVASHYEGETLIVPVMEEVLVIEKRLVLKEELHIRKRTFEAHQPQKHIVRSEEVVVEHLPASEDPMTGEPQGADQTDPAVSKGGAR